MKKAIHLGSSNQNGTRIACGKNPDNVRHYDDHVSTTCKSCLKLVEIAGRTGEMIKGF